MRYGILTIILAASIVSACSDSDGAKRALEDAGMEQVRTEGWSLFGCDEKDTFHTRFSAVNHNGRKVSGIVCSGWLKGSTIRFD